MHPFSLYYSRGGGALDDGRADFTILSYSPLPPPLSCSIEHMLLIDLSFGIPFLRLGSETRVIDCVGVDVAKVDGDDGLQRN